jgi:hypothetical protein
MTVLAAQALRLFYTSPTVHCCGLQNKHGRWMGQICLQVIEHGPEHTDPLSWEQWEI